MPEEREGLWRGVGGQCELAFFYLPCLSLISSASQHNQTHWMLVLLNHRSTSGIGGAFIPASKQNKTFPPLLCIAQLYLFCQIIHQLVQKRSTVNPQSVVACNTNNRNCFESMLTVPSQKYPFFFGGEKSN